MAYYRVTVGGGSSMPSWLITGVVTPVSDTKSITIPLNAGVRPTFAAIYKVDMDEDLGVYNQLLSVGLRGDTVRDAPLTSPMCYSAWNGTINAASNNSSAIQGITDFDATSVTFVTRDPNANYAYKAGMAYRYIICLKESTTKTLSSISATKTKTSYDVDEQFSTADVTVTASYSDSTSADVTSSATIGTVDTSTAGNKSLSISYTEDGVTKTTTISITVAASEIPDYILSNKSYSGESGSEGFNLASESFSVEAGKDLQI